MVDIDIEDSRLAIRFQKVKLFTDTTLNLQHVTAHQLEAYYKNNIPASLVNPSSLPVQ